MQTDHNNVRAMQRQRIKYEKFEFECKKCGTQLGNITVPLYTEIFRESLKEFDCGTLGGFLEEDC